LVSGALVSIAGDPGPEPVAIATAVVPQSRSAPPALSIGLTLGRRLAVAVATVIAVSMLVFVAIEVVPIDPAMHALGRESTPEQREVFRQRMHLDDPPLQRYLRWGGNLLDGNFGTSVTSGIPVGQLLAQRLQNTAALGVTALEVSIDVGLPLAV